MATQAPSRPAGAQGVGNAAPSGSNKPASSLFTPVDAKTLAGLKVERESRSSNVLEQFMAANMYGAQLSDEAMTQRDGSVDPQSFASRMNAHARTHDIPVYARHFKGEVYLTRLDRDEQGNPVTNWREIAQSKKRQYKKRDAKTSG